jgi:uncharacterized membrane protein
MDKRLQDYIEFIEKESKKPTPELIEYHKAMTAQFQHERLVHLIVTLFFALFMIIFFVFFGAVELMLPAGIWENVIAYSIGAVAVILLITTLFYVRHYYRLENGVQKLEEITRKLYGHKK